MSFSGLEASFLPVCLSYGNFIIALCRNLNSFLITFLDDMVFNCMYPSSAEHVGVVIANLNLEHFVFHGSTLCSGI